MRSLAVAPECRGTGLGTAGEALVPGPRRRLSPDLALTLREGFFNRLGFVTVDHWAISPKIWHECIYCPSSTPATRSP